MEDFNANRNIIKRDIMLLAIAIPTYQRPELLLKTLRSVCHQITGRTDVGVYIYDDSDGRENSRSIDVARCEFPLAFIEYSINEKNLGIDENIKRCLDSTSAEYVWLLGEDDLLTDGAIPRTLEAIQKYRPAFIFENYIYADDQHRRFSNSAVLQEGRGTYLQGFNDFISDYAWAIGFIGGCVVRAADWRRQRLGAFVGTYYSHVGGIIGACLDLEIVVIGDIQVLNRAEDIGTFTWSSRTFEVYFSFYEVLRNSRLSERPQLLNSALRSAARLFNVYSLVWLGAKRADGVYNIEIYRGYYRSSLKRSWLWKAVALLISLLPRSPLRWVRYFHLKRRFLRISI